MTRPDPPDRRRDPRGHRLRRRRPPSRSRRPTWTASRRSTATSTPSCTSTPRARSRRPPGSTRASSTGPLAGVPLALKDVLCQEGVPTTVGSKILEGWRPPYDATVTARLKEAGVVILGKTNMDEFAMGSSTEHSAYGPTHNPWDLDRIPGGSGGGSAAAVAAYEAPLAIGTDTGGSIRQPAAVTGTVGVKPTYGGVSRYGLVAFSSSLDQAGPCARTVLDAALLHEVIARPRPGRLDLDPAAGAAGGRGGAARRVGRRLAGLRIGVVKELAGEGYEPGVQARFDEAVEVLTGLGATVVEVSCPHFVYALPAYYLIAPSEALEPGPLRQRPLRPAGRRRRRGRARGGHVADPRAGLRPRGQAAHRPRHLRAVQRLLRRLLRAGAEGPHAHHARLHRGVRAGRRARLAGRAHGRLPARREARRPARDVPPGPRHDPDATSTAGRRCRCPCGLSEGLPVGFQVMAPTLHDDRLYRVGAALEARAARPLGRPAAGPGARAGGPTA